MGKRLFKATLIVSGMTLLSRISGFVRDMLVARIFGVDLATDAFFVVFKIPNFLRRLFNEGSFAHAFVPVLTEKAQQGENQELKEFIGKTAGTLAAVLGVITLLAMLLAPLLVLVLAPGFVGQSAQNDLAVYLLRIMLPYGFFVLLVAYIGAVLNVHERYAIPAITPVLLNVCMIAAALWLAPRMAIPIASLAWGVLLAGLVQLLFQLPSLAKLGLLPKLQIQLNDPEVRQVNNRLLPAVFSSSVTQINLLFDTLIASFLASGSVSWLYYSDRLVEFPLGILGMGLATVILPNLSGNHAGNNKAAFSATLDWGLRLVLLIGLPAMIGLFLLAEPILSSLFQYDEFTAKDVKMAGRSLQGYAVGMLGFLFIKILVPGFTARQDLKTPVRYGWYAVIASFALNVLAIPLAHAGLALATSLGAMLNALLLLTKLMRDGIYQPEQGWSLFLMRLLLASAAMVFILYYYVDANLWQAWQSTERLINLAKWIVISGLAYVLTLVILGLRPKHLTMTNPNIEAVGT